ncbi:MAG: helix-turn-helix transcriptional regulator [Chloroflexi bacterium]|nr:helix-turn-helix transcriptional regulator [Chloroflexota bacterium]
MSPHRPSRAAPPRFQATAVRLCSELGREIRDARVRRGWTLATLAERVGLSVSMVHGVESGKPTMPEGYVRLALALNLQPRFTLLGDQAATAARAVDPVHSAMGEIEAEQLGIPPVLVRIDEPYQHYQFAGRADLVAFAPATSALLHIENRTRFPDVQGFAGSFNAKCRYLADELAPRFGVRSFTSVTHVVVALWSAEVLHVLRLRGASFRAIAPDDPGSFAGWWQGQPPTAGTRTSIVVFDPLPGGRRSRRRWIGLEDVVRGEPRYRDYADALGALRRAGRA